MCQVSNLRPSCARGVFVNFLCLISLNYIFFSINIANKTIQLLKFYREILKKDIVLCKKKDETVINLLNNWIADAQTRIRAGDAQTTHKMVGGVTLVGGNGSELTRLPGGAELNILPANGNALH